HWRVWLTINITATRKAPASNDRGPHRLIMTRGRLQRRVRRASGDDLEPLWPLRQGDEYRKAALKKHSRSGLAARHRDRTQGVAAPGARPALAPTAQPLQERARADPTWKPALDTVAHGAPASVSAGGSSSSGPASTS